MSRLYAVVGSVFLVACQLDGQDAPDATVTGGPAQCYRDIVVADVFGNVVSWNGGAALPAGHYKITYADGCMEYSPSGQGWTVNAVIGETGCVDGLGTLYVMANGTPLAPAPGTVGCLLGGGAMPSFDACVAANHADDVPLEFDFAGGTLGLWLQDSPYDDNLTGDGGRSPTYLLSSSSCD